MTPGRRLGALAVVATAAVGCRNSGAVGAGWTSADSAGVEIVVNRPTPALPRWMVAGSHVVRIGSVAGPEVDNLFGVVGAAVLSDHRIAVANAGTGEIRFYAANGRFERASGRRGNGPGEYQAMKAMWRYRGDSLLVFDFRFRRYSVLDHLGRFGRSFTMAAPDTASGQGNVNDVLADGRLLALTSTPISPSEEAGVSRPTERLFLYSPEGKVARLIGRFPGYERYVGPGGSAGLRRFGSKAIVRGGDGTIVVGSTHVYEMGIYTPDGRLRRIIRCAQPSNRVDADDIARERERHRAEIAQFSAWPAVLRNRHEALVTEMKYPQEFPAYADVRVDDGGVLWVRDYLPVDESEGGIWSVFDPRGRLTAIVEVPPGLKLYQVNMSHVLVGWKDELDVEYVELRAVLRH